MLAPESVTVPVPSLVKVPLVVPMMPVMAVSPAPPTVRPIAAPVMPPERVRVPASELILLAAPSATAPVQALLPEMLRRAPSAAMPVPLMVRVSPVTVMPFCICRAAPDVTVTPPAPVPSAVLF